MTTFNSQSTGSTSSSASSKDKYDLPYNDENVLVYKKDPDVKNAWVKIMKDSELCDFLDKSNSTGVHLKCARKSIPAGAKVVSVRLHDTFNEPEATMFADYPNPWDADIKIPPKAYWLRLLAGKYDELYIVSKVNRPSDHKTRLDIGSGMSSRTGTCASPTEYE